MSNPGVNFPPVPEYTTSSYNQLVQNQLIVEGHIAFNSPDIYANAPTNNPKALGLGSDGTVGTIAGGGVGVTQIVAGTNVTISPFGGTGTVTINSTGGGGGGGVTSLAAGTGISVSGSTGAVTVGNTQGVANGPLLTTIPTVAGKSVSQKQMRLPANASTTIANVSGTGIVRGIWIALAFTDPELCYISGTFDGAGSPQIGTGATSGNRGQVLNLSAFLTNGWLQTTVGNNFTIRNPLDETQNQGGATWAANICGSPMATNTGGTPIYAGYYRMDMPFSTSFLFSLYNNSSVVGSLYYKIDYDIGVINEARRLFIRPFNYSSFTSSTTVWQELPLMTSITAGSSGAILKGFKMMLTAPNTSLPTEGRVRVYSGGSGMTANQATTTYTYTGTVQAHVDSTSLSYYATTGGGTVLQAWTGTEDTFQNAETWSGLPLYATDLYGTVANFTDNASPPNAYLTLYRFFTDTAPGVAASQVLSVSYVPGDPCTGGGSGSMSGCTFYYA